MGNSFSGIWRRPSCTEVWEPARSKGGPGSVRQHPMAGGEGGHLGKPRHFAAPASPSWRTCRHQSLPSKFPLTDPSSHSKFSVCSSASFNCHPQLNYIPSSLTTLPSQYLCLNQSRRVSQMCNNGSSAECCDSKQTSKGGRENHSQSQVLMSRELPLGQTFQSSPL